jgi:release factor glutamine methyltransferase
MTRGEFLRTGALPRQELAQLLCAALSVDRAQIYTAPDVDVPTPVLRTLQEQVRRRQEGWPLQYLLGTAWFWSRQLSVGPGVLVPRPETEILVQEALRRAPAGGRIADIGTGSGAIALALGVERPDLHITAVEKSRRALRYARKNLAGIAEVVEGDLLSPIHAAQDVIVSNPPYVSADEYRTLPPDVRREPRAALYGGEDGLAVVRRLAGSAPKHLERGGWLMLEIGAGQAESARKILEQKGFLDCFSQVDLAGIPRVVGGRTPC